MALTDNLLAFYKLSDLSDSSGNNRTLTNNGNVSFASGKIGNAAVFDGAGWLVDENNSWSFGNGFTFSAWIKITNDQVAENKLFGGSASDGSNVFYGAILTNYGDGYFNGQPFAELGQGLDAFALNENNTLRVQPNTWTFVTFACDNVNWSAWVNGDKVTFPTASLNPTALTSFKIGAGNDFETPFNGQIDAVGIWNRALSDSEVAALYNSGTGLELEVQAPPVDLEDGLQAFYKLSDLSDSSGNNRTLTNNGNVSFASGKIGNAAVFDGQSHFSATPFLETGTSLTISVWVSTLANSYSYLIGANGPVDGASIVMNGEGYTAGYCGGWPEYGEISGPQVALNDGAWHHIVLKANNGSATVYVDGVAGTASAVPETILSSGYMCIGVNGEANFAFLDGKLDAVGIWNRALSDSEVAALYNSGTGLELPVASTPTPTPTPTSTPTPTPTAYVVKNGWINNTYWINDVATSLDQNGDGKWQGKLYENGALFSGTKYSLTFIDGLAQPETVVTTVGNSVPVAFGLSEAEEPLVELVFASITSAGETVIEQIVPTVLPTGYTVAQTILAYSIDTTATFEGTINVDFILPTNISQAVFDRVKGFHVKNNGTIEEMTRVSSDFSTKRITVAITSFSDFLFLDELQQTNKTVKKINGKAKFNGRVKFSI